MAMCWDTGVRGRLEELQGSLGGWNDARGARVQLDRHAQRARERLEDRLALVMGIVTTKVVDVHCRLRVVHEPLEELVREVDVELADASPAKIDVPFQPRPAGEVHHG